MSLLFTEDHEWVAVDGDIATVGISGYASDELGEIVYVDLCDEGDEIAKGVEFGSLESVKTVSGLYAPVSGEVVEVNSAVVDGPELISNSPQDEGWLVKIRLEDTEELSELLSAEDYQNHLDSL